ncbi:amidase [Rhizodiscina lignyota]|uniref:Amidase n=1 Tax=Rhizodiscina lignyota TaxID=1504668 RepID=A0A9P4M723_9PEZI|nr:amidase [Rhizodiscina lignyota]
MDWRRLAESKREALRTAIPSAWRLAESDIPPAARLKDVVSIVPQFLSPLELQITNSPPMVIIEEVQNLNWSALEVTRAFCHRAAIAHQLTNCLAEICFEAAEKRASELDTSLRITGRTTGPLHGLPISLKDRFHVSGLETACGYVSWLGSVKSAKDEGVLVQRLRQAGAIIIAKTNVPMSMLIAETVNNIVGSTINPYNRCLSAGGACGGEGALLALRGSPMGWGSDIAGSVRIPCGFNNIFGLRPSFGRISRSGMAQNLAGLPTGASVVGPMCADLTSLTAMVKWIISSNSWQDDHEVIDLPWNEERFTSTRNRICQPGKGNGTLVFGMMSCDGEVLPHPPVRRAMRMVKDALLQSGYEVLEWNPPPHSPAADVLFQILGSTAGEEVRKAIHASHEPPIPQLSELFGSGDMEPSPTSEFWKLCDMREAFRAQYHEYWKSTRELTACRRAVDGVILPTAAHAAPPEGTFKYHAYTAIPSTLDFTTGVVPVTFADCFIDNRDVNYQPLGARDRANWHLYHEDLFDGAPVGVQVMGQRLQEEKVLAMMEAVQNALQQYRMG